MNYFLKYSFFWKNGTPIKEKMQYLKYVSYIHKN